MEIKVVGETRNMLVVSIDGFEVRVPKDPERIPENSIGVRVKGKLKDVTDDVKKAVAAYMAEKEKKEKEGS